jgi:hypothetical protein
VLGGLEPGKAVPEELVLTGAVSFPELVPLEPCPASPESLELELLPEPAKPLPPALELKGVPEFAVVCPAPALLEPEPFVVVGRELLPAVLPGRVNDVLSPPATAVLGVAPPAWLGRDDSAVDGGLTGTPEGLESRLEVGL